MVVRLESEVALLTQDMEKVRSAHLSTQRELDVTKQSAEGLKTDLARARDEVEVLTKRCNQVRFVMRASEDLAFSNVFVARRRAK